MRNGPYELIVAPEAYVGKRYRGRYAYEHHVVYWEAFAIIPSRGDVIHHINGDRRDNRLENLELIPMAKHSAMHSETEMVENSCGQCSKKIWLKPHKLRDRLKKSRWGVIFCSLRCGALHQSAKYRATPTTQR